MRTEPGGAKKRRARGAVAALAAAAAMACAQQPAAPASRAQEMFVPAETVESQAQESILCEIDDPGTGDRWLLERNEELPGGPGRLVLVAARRDAAALPAGGSGETRFRPVIRAGDRLIVEEHTEHVDAALEARALTPAIAGAALDVRLALGGRVVKAVALGPGRAALREGARP